MRRVPETCRLFPQHYFWPWLLGGSGVQRKATATAPPKANGSHKKWGAKNAEERARSRVSPVVIGLAGERHESVPFTYLEEKLTTKCCKVKGYTHDILVSSPP